MISEASTHRILAARCSRCDTTDFCPTLSPNYCQKNGQMIGRMSSLHAGVGQVLQTPHVLGELHGCTAGEGPRRPLPEVGGDLSGVLVAQEVETELHRGEVDLLQQPVNKQEVMRHGKEETLVRQEVVGGASRQAEDTRVEVERTSRIFDPQHGLLHHEVLQRPDEDQSHQCATGSDTGSIFLFFLINCTSEMFKFTFNQVKDQTISLTEDKNRTSTATKKMSDVTDQLTLGQSGLCWFGREQVRHQ